MRLLIAVKFLEEILALTNRPNLQALIVVYHHYIIKVFKYDNDDISVLHGRRDHFFIIHEVKGIGSQSSNVWNANEDASSNVFGAFS